MSDRASCCLTSANCGNVCGVSCGFRFRPTLGLKIQFSEPFSKRGNRSEPSSKRGLRSSPRERQQRKKIMAFRKRKHCCSPHALEVTNLNGVASNLPRTCFKSKSLPNSVIFITELHLHVFLTLYSGSDSGKSLST